MAQVITFIVILLVLGMIGVIVWKGKDLENKMQRYLRIIGYLLGLIVATSILIYLVATFAAMCDYFLKLYEEQGNVWWIQVGPSVIFLGTLALCIDKAIYCIRQLKTVLDDWLLTKPKIYEAIKDWLFIQLAIVFVYHFPSLLYEDFVSSWRFWLWRGGLVLLLLLDIVYSVIIMTRWERLSQLREEPPVII